MKKNIGAVVGLYPTPVTVIGSIVNGKATWNNIAHIGIVGLDSIMLSIRKGRYTSIGIKENKVLSVNLVNEEMLEATDYVGIVSGHKVDKSEVFEYHMGELNTPIINKSYLSMECELVDIYEYGNYENFILKVVNTYVEEEKLNDEGKVDYEKVRPLLFEMPTRTYLKTGDKVGKCWNEGKDYAKK